MGGKRAVNLVRHLPHCGWHPVVLAAPARPGRHDFRPLATLPPDARVVRRFISPLRPLVWKLLDTRTSARGPGSATVATRGHRPASALASIANNPHLTPLDHYMWDLPAACHAARELALQTQARAVVVNADPWSGLMVGLMLNRKLRLPLIADFRDPWALHPVKRKLRPRPTRRCIDALEYRVVSRAGKVILNTRACADHYRKWYAGSIPRDRFTAVRNAFDPVHFPPGVKPARIDFALHHFGATGSYRKPLAKMFQGFARFVGRQGLDQGRAGLFFHGEPEDGWLDRQAADLSLSGYIHRIPYAPLHRAVATLRGASVLVLPAYPEPQVQIPAKLYDYLAVDRPVLAIDAGEEIQEIVKKTGAGLSTAPEDGPEAVAGALDDLYAGRAIPHRGDADQRDRFSAAFQSKQFAAILDSAVAGGNGSEGP